MNDYTELLFSLHSLSVYRGVLDDPAVRRLLRLLDLSARNPMDTADDYGELLRTLQESGLSLADYIYRAVLYDENAFTRLSAQDVPLPETLLDAVRRDLRAIQKLAYLEPDVLRGVMSERCPSLRGPIELLPGYAVAHSHYLTDETDWANEVDSLRDFCRENGCGEDARFNALTADDEAVRRLLETGGPRIRRLLARRCSVK